MNKLIYLGTALIMAAAFTSCKDDDPGMNVTPPVVESAPNTITGIITNQQGEPLAGATVSTGSLIATTDPEGVYHLNSLPAGTYHMTASYKGLVSATGDVVITDSHNTTNHVWSAQLLNAPSAGTRKFPVTALRGGRGEIESVAIHGNEKAAIMISVDAGPETFNKNADIVITPVYTYEEAVATAARGDMTDMMLLGANIHCDDPSVVLTKPVDLSFDVDHSVSDIVETRKLVDGHWTVIDHTVANGKVTVSADELGSYALFIPVDVTETPVDDNVTISPSVYDNLYGTSVITADRSNYTYTMGGKFEHHGDDTLKALLIEHLARLVNPESATTTAEYPLDIKLSIGTGLELSAVQQNTRVTLTSGSTSVSGISYGTVTVTVRSYNRDHNGGSN